MRLKRLRFDGLINGLSRTRSGLLLLSGAAALLSGVERWMSPAHAPTPRASVPNPPVAAIAKPKREHYFAIRQTRSELGYVYWVLQGYGAFASFSLHDTWREAMDEANTRLSVVEMALV